MSVGTHFCVLVGCCSYLSIQDRLEPAFMISPLASRIPPTEAVCDLVVVRPFRSPTVFADTPETRAVFVTTLWKVLGEAYRKGSHVDLRYNDKGEVTSEGDGPSVVEYIRCGGWEWIPVCFGKRFLRRDI
jgi:hypothetical protein